MNRGPPPVAVHSLDSGAFQHLPEPPPGPRLVRSDRLPCRGEDYRLAGLWLAASEPTVNVAQSDESATTTSTSGMVRWRLPFVVFAGS